jgi:hypothetical protein
MCEWLRPQQYLEAATKEIRFAQTCTTDLKVIHVQTPSLRDVPEDILESKGINKSGPKGPEPPRC